MILDFVENKKEKENRTDESRAPDSPLLRQVAKGSQSPLRSPEERRPMVSPCRSYLPTLFFFLRF